MKKIAPKSGRYPSATQIKNRKKVVRDLLGHFDVGEFLPTISDVRQFTCGFKLPPRISRDKARSYVEAAMSAHTPSELRNYLEAVAPSDKPVGKQPKLPHIEEVFAAFQQFQNASLHAMWNKAELDAARAALKTKLESFGLAHLIDWSEPE
jgi:hypothetical protein